MSDWGEGGVVSNVAGTAAAVATVATEVIIQRTEGQVFRERLSFILLCLIGTYCAMCLLIELKSILEPFLWALFLVMAWKPVVDAIEKRIERALGIFCCCVRREGVYPRTNARGDENIPPELMHILGNEDQETATLLTDMSRSDQHEDESECDTRARQSRSTAPLHRNQPSRARGGCQDLDGDDFERVERVRAARRQRLARGLAVLIALFLTLSIFAGFGFMILESARRMRSHWDVYQRGAQKLTNDSVFILGKLFQKVPERIRARYEVITNDVMTSAQDFLYAILGSIVNNVTSLLLGGLLTLLYTLFWLCSPLPIDSSIDVMFRRYIMLKTLACFGYGACVGMFLAFLSIDMASVFALTTFALNYVPEVGPFVAMLLPCPVILLDSRLDQPFLVLFTAIAGQLALKFAFSNIVEVKLIDSDKKLRMHPVMMLLSVCIFGFLWGPTGMLLSVPLMALLKLSLFSEHVPSSYRDPILVLLEGDRDAPWIHRNAFRSSDPRPQTAARGG
eukprot:TRINITY_DN43009_c0_g1_i1.p1 TRINITY_DN43009_c0_g1~~TRINITY_DN43009_c0_g1_i1.p1  ORF type:complete len:508 (+),score=69.70 TRINITY_DN43009_c0_g1_i1:113-1636(+)